MKAKWRKGTAFLLTLVMLQLQCFSVLAEEKAAEPVSDTMGEAVQQEETEESLQTLNDGGIQIAEESYINPVYAGVVQEADLLQPEKGEGVSAYDEPEYLDSVEEAGIQMRNGMRQREESIVIYFQADEYSAEWLYEITDQALLHTGVPTEGDYLKWQYAGWRTSTSYYESNNRCFMTITYTITYYTTKEQEDTVDEAVKGVLNELDVSDAGDYKKICAVYDYICGHTVYDYDNLNDEEYKLKYTAYAALIDGKAVCQGYALLFYRLALELDVDNRLIPGTGNGESHGWNIVKLGEWYYNADSTWDAGSSVYEYFLKGDDFEGHIRSEEYRTEEFYARYPMAEKDYRVPEADASGNCGENLTWTRDSNGTLTISGTGAMDTGEGETIFPDAELILSVVVEKGVTDIGDYAFRGCVNLESIKIADTVKRIGVRAFDGCTKLNGITIPIGVAQIGPGVFRGCGSLTAISVAEGNESYVSADGVLFTSDRKILLAYPGGKEGEYGIPDGTVRIAEQAFCANQNPGKVMVPESVTEVGDQAFGYMEDCLESIRFQGDAPSFGSEVFDYTTTTIYYPDGNETWNTVRETLQNTGGTLTWDSYGVHLDAPVITSVYSTVQTAVKVTWSKAEGASGYELYRAESPLAEGEATSAEDASGQWFRAKTIASGDTVQYTNQGLEKGKTYYYKVRAYAEDSDGVRVYSEFSEIQYMPAAVVFENVYSNSTSRIRLLWNEVDGSHGYQIWRRGDDGTYSIVKTLGDKGNTLTDDQGGTTAYSNTGLKAGGTYVYKMRAFAILDGKKVFGAYSDEFTVAVMPKSPDLTVSSGKEKRVALSWNEVEGAAGYQIWRAEGDLDTYTIVKSIVGGNVTSYVNSGLESGRIYAYKIRAYTEIQGKITFGMYSDIKNIQVK